MKSTIRAKFNALTESDRRAVVICGVFLLAVVIWSLVLKPSHDYYQEKKQNLAASIELSQWMELNFARFESISNSSTLNDSGEETDLIQLLSNLARSKEIEVNRFDPISEGRMRSTYVRVPFDKLLSVLYELEQSGVIIDTLNLDATETSGFVNATLVVSN